jgi:hypothetical protein
VLEDEGREFEVAPPVKEDTLDAELDHTLADPGDIQEAHLEGDTPSPIIQKYGDSRFKKRAAKVET